MPDTPDRPGSLGELVHSYLNEQCTVLLASEASLRHGHNDHVVHDTRVAARRVRSTLRIFGEVFDVPQAGHLEEELTWWAQLLGAVRDLDVLGARLQADIADLSTELVLGPVSATLAETIAGQRTEAYHEVLASLDDPRSVRLKALIQQWCSQPPMTPEAEAPAAHVKRYVKRAERKLRQRLGTAVVARRAGEPAHELLHRARKAGKRHRYAVELAAPVWGDKAEQTLARLKGLQEVLGDHQDSIVSAAFLRDLGARFGARSGQNGFTFGVLYARELESEATLLTRLEPYL